MVGKEAGMCPSFLFSLVLWTYYEHYVSALSFLLESKAFYLRFFTLFDLFFQRYFPDIFSFLQLQNENLIKSLKQWNNLVSIKSATRIIDFMT